MQFSATMQVDHDRFTMTDMSWKDSIGAMAQMTVAEVSKTATVSDKQHTHMQETEPV